MSVLKCQCKCCQRCQKRHGVRAMGKAWQKLANDKQAKEFLAMQLLLRRIAEMGKNMKPEIIDWQAIGKNATYLARQHLAPKCKECGQVTSQAKPEGDK